MRKNLIFLFILIILSCTKYKEQLLPHILRTGAAFEGTWQLKKIIIDGKDSTIYYRDSLGILIRIYYHGHYENERMLIINNKYKDELVYEDISIEKNRITIPRLIFYQHGNNRFGCFYFSAPFEQRWEVLKFKKHDYFKAMFYFYNIKYIIFFDYKK